MNSKNTWVWLVVAGALFASIVFYQRHRKSMVTQLGRVLPGLKAAAVTNVQVRPGTQLKIQADRTNGVWQLTEPVVYPAQSVSVEHLLDAIEKLTPATYITARELKDRPKADEEFGFATPQATITLQQPGYHALLQIGALTAPGDQVFLQVPGIEGVYVVDAGLLNYLPRTANDWRDTTLIDLNAAPFDRLSVTNGAKVFELRKDPTNKLWRIVYPFYPLPARANTAKIEECLQKLHSVRIQQFLPDEPKPDLEALGLQPPELELAVGQGTNTVALLQFGKSPTNDPQVVYARRAGQNAIVTVPNDLLAPWREKVNDYRDPHLINLTQPPDLIEVQSPESFSVRRQTNGSWRVLPQDFAADGDLMKEWLASLNVLPIVEFVNDVVIAQDLPTYGLAPPARQYLLKATTADAAAGGTNTLIAELDFGTNRADKVFARRADESFIYAVKQADFARLPEAGWQLRERQVWSFSTNDVAQVTIRQGDRTRQVKRNGPYSWSLMPGSQGSINVLAVESIVGELGQLRPLAWVARGDENRARYGFSEKGHQITFDLKNGDKPTLELGGEAPSGLPYAAAKVDGKLWIFEFPPALYQHLLGYLTIPPGVP